MYKYRILNQETNQLFPEDEAILKPNGTLFVNGERFEGKFEVQSSIQLPDQPDIYVGDAVSYTFEDDGKEPNYLDHLLTSEWHYVPKANTYDEIIIQFVQDEDNRMYYWAMFKYKGAFIKNEACNMPDETMPKEIRAIPTTSIRILRGLTEVGNYKIIYNCTDKQWASF